MIIIDPRTSKLEVYSIDRVYFHNLVAMEQGNSDEHKGFTRKVATTSKKTLKDWLKHREGQAGYSFLIEDNDDTLIFTDPRTKSYVACCLRITDSIDAVVAADSFLEQLPNKR